MVQFHGRNLDRNVSPIAKKTFTKSDLSQVEFNSFSFSKWRYDEIRSPEELNAINKQRAGLYEQYKNESFDLKKEAQRTRESLQNPGNYSGNKTFKQSLEILSKLDLPRTARF